MTEFSNPNKVNIQSQLTQVKKDFFPPQFQDNDNTYANRHPQAFIDRNGCLARSFGSTPLIHRFVRTNRDYRPTTFTLPYVILAIFTTVIVIFISHHFGSSTLQSIHTDKLVATFKMGNFLSRLSCMRKEKYEVIPRSHGPWRHQFVHHVAAQEVKVFSISSSQAPPSVISSVGATRDGSIWGVPHYLSNRPTILDYPWEMMEEQAWEDGVYIQQAGYGHLNEAYYSQENFMA